MTRIRCPDLRSLIRNPHPVVRRRITTPPFYSTTLCTFLVMSSYSSLIEQYRERLDDIAKDIAKDTINQEAFYRAMADERVKSVAESILTQRKDIPDSAKPVQHNSKYCSRVSGEQEHHSERVEGKTRRRDRHVGSDGGGIGGL